MPAIIKKFFDYIKTHKVTAIIILVVVLIGGYYLYKKTHAAAGVTSYLTAAAQKATVVAAVTGTGQVAASNQIDIKPQTDGRITTLNIQQNQQVKAGDVLAVIDQQSAANSVAQARAQLEQAQANYDKLVAGATQNTIQTQQLSVQSAQSALDQAKKNYDNTSATQQQAVDKALSNFLNGDLAAEPSDINSTVTITISGNYTGTDKGSYAISLYQAGDGLHYSASGLGNGSGVINRGLSQPIGNGLYINFSSTGTINLSTTWTINLPNIKSSSYLNNLNAYNTSLQSQKQALDQAQNSIDTAKNNLDKTNLAYQNTVAPPTDADIASAKAQITSAQAQLANAQTAYNNTVLKAPFDGVAAAVNFAAGDKVTAGTTVATLITNQQIAKISLNEVDVAKIKLGDSANMTFDAIDSLEMTGKVAQIDTIGTVSQGVVSYGVKIAMDTKNDQVKPGMSVSVNVITDVATDVLTVPNAAVKTNTSGGNYVQVLGSDGKPQNITVQIGIADDTNTEIKSGLNEGDNVVTQTITSGATTGATQSSSSLRIPGITGGGAVRVGGGATGR